MSAAAWHQVAPEQTAVTASIIRARSRTLHKSLFPCGIAGELDLKGGFHNTRRVLGADACFRFKRPTGRKPSDCTADDIMPIARADLSTSGIEDSQTCAHSNDLD